MATYGFTPAAAQELLLKKITAGTSVGLSSTAPTEEGKNFTEFRADMGYKRATFGTINTKKDGQIANDDIIFFFVALGNMGSATHLGLFESILSKTPFFVAELDAPLEIQENYVPLIREHKFIIGLDVDVIDENYE